MIEALKQSVKESFFAKIYDKTNISIQSNTAKFEVVIQSESHATMNKIASVVKEKLFPDLLKLALKQSKLFTGNLYYLININ